MRFCNICQVKIENNTDTCPLCNGKTEKLSDDFSNSYPEIKIPLLYDIITRVLLFLATGGSIICIFINTFTGNIPWSFICVAANFYLYFSVKTILKSILNIPLTVLIQVLLLSILTPIIDYSIGFTGWSVNFVIPFVIIAGSVTLFVFSKLDFINFNGYIVYFVILAVIGIIPFILVLMNVVFIKWPSIACILYSLLSMLFMLIFFTRKFKSELSKRFHF